MSPTLFGPAKKTVFFLQRCCVFASGVKGATATPSDYALGVWQEGRRCAERGEGTQRRARAEGLENESRGASQTAIGAKCR